MSHMDYYVTRDKALFFSQSFMTSDGIEVKNTMVSYNNAILPNYDGIFKCVECGNYAVQEHVFRSGDRILVCQSHKLF